MSDRIRLLPDVVANQIAAGEVVNNPSSVVKEMMENAVDAGATRVTVNFRDGGRELIQVVDNGCGMSPLDARMAFDRHATSKIRQAEDIYALHTFGFRGEALASIAAVAEVEVRTRQKDDEAGTSVEIGGGKFRAQNVVSCPEGTQFLVRNLFYNLPARKRFMGTGPEEARKIREEFRRVALCYPNVAFQLYDNDAPLFNLPPSNLSGRIVGVMGKNIASNLLEVKAETSIVRVEGFVGRPAASKQRNQEMYLFVNGRFFKNNYLQSAVLKAYEKLIPANTKPSYFIYLTVDPEKVDVNVHPQKTEVKFEDAGAVWQIVNAAVRESLGKLGAVPMMEFDADTSIEIPVHREGIAYRNPEIEPNPDFNPFIERESGVSGGSGVSSTPRGSFAAEDFMDYRSSLSDSGADFASAGFSGADDADRSMIEFIEGQDAWQGMLEIESGQMFAPALPLGGRYCATALEGELVVVDVPRAWEAVLYERYLAMAGNGAVPSQGLLFPEAAALSMEECSLAREYRAELLPLGFSFTVPDEHTVLLTAVPADFTGEDCAALLRDLLAALAGQEFPAAEVRIQALAATMARNGAAGKQAASQQALDELLSALAGCAHANYTPGGLPVMLRIAQDEIKRRL